MILETASLNRTTQTLARPARKPDALMVYGLSQTTLHILPEPHMPQYLIERNIPGAGKLSPDELQAISRKSCSVLSDLGPQIKWVHSYVTDDQIHCIYHAPNEAMVREHARQGGFPADRVSEIRTTIDPTTAG